MVFCSKISGACSEARQPDTFFIVSVNGVDSKLFDSCVCGRAIPDSLVAPAETGGNTHHCVNSPRKDV